MIPIKINGKQTNVPAIGEITTGQYIELIKIPNFNLIDYLAVVLGMSNKMVEDLRVKNPKFLASQLFPTVPDYSMASHRDFIVVKGVMYKLCKDFTLGQRFKIEENGKNKEGFDLIVYILAINSGAEIKDILQTHAKNILPEAFFLLQNLSHGRSLGMRFLRIFRRLIKILKSKNRQV